MPSFREVLARQSLVVVVHYAGLSVADSEALRSEVIDSGASVRVVKNTLARLCVRDTKHGPLEASLKGMSALVFSEDPVAAARSVVGFSRKNDNLAIIAGVLNGDLLTSQDVKNLADMPSLDELRSQLLRTLAGPATRLVTLLNEPASCVVRALDQRR